MWGEESVVRESYHTFLPSPLSTPQQNANPRTSEGTRDAGGRGASRTLGNGVAQSRTWRGDNLPKTIVVGSVTNLTYSWDSNKRKTAEANAVFAVHTNNYNGYDDEDRLTGVV